jgi:hypothetical protein
MQQRSPDEFEEACTFDEAIRLLPGVKGECFVHSSCVPLRDIDFSRTRSERRAVVRGQTLSSIVFVFDLLPPLPKPRSRPLQEVWCDQESHEHSTRSLWRSPRRLEWAFAHPCASCAAPSTASVAEQRCRLRSRPRRPNVKAQTKTH